MIFWTFYKKEGIEVMNSLWLKNIEESPKYEFPELQEDLEADICIIGAGIFGISTETQS